MILMKYHTTRAATGDSCRSMPDAHHIEGVALRSPSLDRIIASKRATNRPKDRAQLPILEATLLTRQVRDVE